MGKTFMILLVAGFAVDAAHGQTRTPAAAPERVGAIRGEVRPAVLQHDAVTSSTGRPLTVEDAESSRRQAQARPRREGERRQVTFFRINSEVGEIAVQPVAGRANGLQFSLGF